MREGAVRPHSEAKSRCPECMPESGLRAGLPAPLTAPGLPGGWLQWRAGRAAFCKSDGGGSAPDFHGIPCSALTGTRNTPCLRPRFGDVNRFVSASPPKGRRGAQSACRAGACTQVLPPLVRRAAQPWVQAQERRGDVRRREKDLHMHIPCSIFMLLNRWPSALALCVLPRADRGTGVWELGFLGQGYCRCRCTFARRFEVRRPGFFRRLWTSLATSGRAWMVRKVLSFFFLRHGIDGTQRGFGAAGQTLPMTATDEPLPQAVMEPVVGPGPADGAVEDVEDGHHVGLFAKEPVGHKRPGGFFTQPP